MPAAGERGVPAASQVSVSDSSAATGLSEPRYRLVGTPFQIPVDDVVRRQTESVGSGPGARRLSTSSWTTRWMLPALREVLSLPLVYFAAVSAGAALWLLALAGQDAPDEPSPALLAGGAALAAAICLITVLGWAALLDERAHRRLWLWSLLTSGAGALVAAASMVLGWSTVLAACAAGALFYTALTSSFCGVISRAGLAADLTVRPYAVRPLGWLWRVPLALLAVGAAAAVAFLAFSLAVISYLPAQPEFALGETIWTRAVESGGVSGAGHVLALIAANGGVAALFGLLFHTAVRTLGWWRGRLHRWWLAIAALTVVVGAAGWLLDSSLPRW